MDFEGFWNKCKSLAGQLKKEKKITVIGHYDADGIASTAIMVKALRRANIETDFINTRQIDAAHISEVNSTDSPTVLFVDMGSGQLDFLQAELKKERFYIIDHHPPVRETDNQVNPFFYGINGTTELSATGACYFVAKAMDEKNMDLSPIGIVGAVGDMQDLHGGLKGANRKILADAESIGYCDSERGLKLFGKQCRSLPKMLEYCSEPLLPGLTGNYMACVNFIKSKGILLNDPASGEPRRYCNLSHEEKKALTSALYMLLLDHNATHLVTDMLIGEVYEFPKEKNGSELRDAKEFATVLNACGRHDKGEVGVTVCMGDRSRAWSDAATLLERHRKELREGIEWIKENGLEEFPHMYFFDGSGAIKETLVGIIAGMSYGAMPISQNKPIIAMGETDEGEIKISGRGNKDLVKRGLKLGQALRNATQPLGGDGGGHDVAAGAKIPSGKKEEFKVAIDAEIAKQIGESK